MRTGTVSIMIAPGDEPHVNVYHDTIQVVLSGDQGHYLYTDYGPGFASLSRSEQLDVLEGWTDRLAREIVLARLRLLRDSDERLPGLGADVPAGEVGASCDAIRTSFS